MNTLKLQPAIATDLYDESLRRVKEYFSTIGQALKIWNQRSIGRSRLPRMNEHLLRDMGISRYEAENIAEQPCWRN